MLWSSSVLSCWPQFTVLIYTNPILLFCYSYHVQPYTRVSVADNPSHIYGVPEGNVNILGGHRFSHSRQNIYEVCPESIQPFWISREPVAWPSCNLAASQRRPYCASVNSQSPVGLVSRQWDAVEWACVLCDRRIKNDRASRSASPQGACPLYSSRAGFFGKASHLTRSVSPPTA